MRNRNTHWIRTETPVFETFEQEIQISFLDVGIARFVHVPVLLFVQRGHDTTQRGYIMSFNEALL